MQIAEEFETGDTHHGHRVLNITYKGDAVINVLTSFGEYSLHVKNPDGSPAPQIRVWALLDELQKGFKL